MRALFVPSLTVAAYSALLIALVTSGVAIAALSIALVALTEEGGEHGESQVVVGTAQEAG